ncbi:type 4 pilus major pilin [Pseudomonas sp. F1002]|uniref:type 4 pilus major pilin n=1 Tax=Pseudomonas sp. F1002 TaxID=2738821 RepID=UPI0015A053C2|nr:type 4 pilus major pilin [Pseudomonas sp. F1002]NWB63512.1 hypothetical protein [Pseudomonas sp. F1002]
MSVLLEQQNKSLNEEMVMVGKSPLGKRMKKQRGVSDLPQLALVILIGTLLAAVAYLVLPGIFAGFRASKITDAFSTSIPSIQTAYQNRTSYAGLTTAQVAQNRWVDSGLTEMAGGQPTGNLVTQWGTLTFLPVSNGTQAQGTLNAVPSRECVKIATALGGDQYITVTINGAAVKTGVTDMDLTAVGTQCNSSNANTIAFTFGRA